MGKADDFLDQAAAEQLAAKCIPGSDQRRQFLEIAEQWRALARQTEDPRADAGDSSEA
jgi:hypothetical protein